MEVKDLKIGVIALGWLGEELALKLSGLGANVWGTTQHADKQMYIKKNSKVDCLIWQNEEGISSELQEKLKETDLLVLNLPPSVFQQGNYAKGLAQFLLFLNEMAKVLFTSSTSVYPSHLIDAKESYVFKEEEINKIREAELQLTSSLGSRVTVLRLAGLIGFERHPVYHLAKKENNDDPNTPVNLIQRIDVIETIKKVIELNYFGEILNVCHPDHPTRKTYYSQKAIQFKLPEIQFNENILNENHKVVNCLKLIDDLHFKNFTPL